MVIHESCLLFGVSGNNWRSTVAEGFGADARRRRRVHSIFFSSFTSLLSTRVSFFSHAFELWTNEQERLLRFTASYTYICMSVVCLCVCKYIVTSLCIFFSLARYLNELLESYSLTTNVYLRIRFTRIPFLKRVAKFSKVTKWDISYSIGGRPSSKIFLSYTKSYIHIHRIVRYNAGRATIYESYFILFHKLLALTKNIETLL